MSEDQGTGSQADGKPAEQQEPPPPPPPPVNPPDGYYEHSEDPPGNDAIDLSGQETKDVSPRERR
jgi:hypothetical protein